MRLMCGQVVVAVTSSEGSDRTDIMLPPEQSTYVQAVGKAQQATAVVAVSPGALLTVHCPPPPPPPPPPVLQVIPPVPSPLHTSQAISRPFSPRRFPSFARVHRLAETIHGPQTGTLG